ncbi:hypothetical protein [Burkholderia stabilis]|uniref:hypothetical protein n=1 Tax=Burkholderia stabilis TaxID=95485 RepID=UPI001F4A75C5|nr:hypothetical protein [Burkholderia stabilis]
MKTARDNAASATKTTALAFSSRGSPGPGAETRPENRAAAQQFAPPAVNGLAAAKSEKISPATNPIRINFN